MCRIQFSIIILIKRWLTEELENDPDEITFIENFWCIGGMLGHGVEYFFIGIEVGNMVFMYYKYFPRWVLWGAKHQNPDTGIGENPFVNKLYSKNLSWSI